MSLAMANRISPEHFFGADQRMSTASSTSPPATPVDGTMTKLAKTLKRKRVGAVSQAMLANGTDAQKKKKASRACLNCQKAHLTCNDSRPCQRCIKKGIADSCIEGHRKKAKYLLSDDELENLKRSKQGENKDMSANVVHPMAFDSVPSTEPIMNIHPDPAFSFGSEATNLEYSMLSAILGNATDDPLLATQSPTYTSYPQSRPPLPQSEAPSGYPHGIPEPWAPSAAQPGQPLPQSSSAPYHHERPAPPTELTMLNTDLGGRQASPGSEMLSSAFTPHTPRSASTFGQPQPRESSSFLRTTGQQQPSSYPAIQPERPVTTDSVEPLASHGTSNVDVLTKMRISDVYRNVNRPYDYTQGYHFLMQYLQQNLDKNDMLRVVRALSIFRPSLIAMQMPLTEEDEIFVERCFQRSLIELEKLITYSGTPTVVWRRTGEICLAGMEFSMLTEWSHQELVGQKKYIYEVFERQSLVEYWEKFAAHAFENATQSIYSHCVLLKPSGEPVPCAFCFSIRRDLFDLPSLIIGQWLPLLG